jgi:hypothetical protein
MEGPLIGSAWVHLWDTQLQPVHRVISNEAIRSHPWESKGQLGKEDTVSQESTKGAHYASSAFISCATPLSLSLK